MPRCRSLLVAPLAVIALLLLVTPAPADTFTNTMYYTTFTNIRGALVHSVVYDYNDVAHTFTLSGKKDLPGAPGADGLIFSPDGKSLLIGGNVGGHIYQVNPSTGAVEKTVTSGLGAVFHLALSPDGKTVYGGGSESGTPGVAVVPANPLANGTGHGVIGSTNTLTGIAFDGKGNGFYTFDGQFGTINLASNPAVTSAKIGLAAAHGIIYDSFTGDFILVGGPEIAQIDPSNPTAVKSFRFFGGENFDQGAVDGLGHLFAASNTGDVVFVDYSKTGLVGDPTNFTNFAGPSADRFLDTNLDDVAPLSGLGSAAAVPEPTSLALLGLGAAALAGWRWKRRQAAA
jgi:sugar lactone lactonase YvrE